MKRFFIVAPKNFGGPVDLPPYGDPRGQYNRPVCAIHDRTETEPNPDHPGYRRYRLVESGLTYFSAVDRCRELNSVG